MSYLPTLKGWIAANVARVVRVDSKTNVLITQDFEHHEIHEGDHFWYLDSISLGVAATQDYLITTPNSAAESHLLVQVKHTAVASVAFYEGADRNGTTLQTVWNSNRNSLTTADTTVHKGQSGGTTDGTLMMTHTFGTSTGAASSSGGEARAMDEQILKTNTKYLLRLTSSTASQLFVTHLVWYEHTPID
ncbi:MAG: hypothetical protein ACWGQW_08015 [bacterium]